MKFCKCRHPKQAHKNGHLDVVTLGKGFSVCQATINAGQYSYPCDCEEYKETY